MNCLALTPNEACIYKSHTIVVKKKQLIMNAEAPLHSYMTRPSPDRVGKEAHLPFTLRRALGTYFPSCLCELPASNQSASRC